MIFIWKSLKNEIWKGLNRYFPKDAHRKSERGSVRSDFKKLDSFTLETTKNHLIRSFLRNGRLRVELYLRTLPRLSNKLSHVIKLYQKYLSLYNLDKVPVIFLDQKTYLQQQGGPKLPLLLLNSSSKNARFFKNITSKMHQMIIIIIILILPFYIDRNYSNGRLFSGAALLIQISILENIKFMWPVRINWS